MFLYFLHGQFLKKNKLMILTFNSSPFCLLIWCKFYVNDVYPNKKFYNHSMGKQRNFITLWCPDFLVTKSLEALSIFLYHFHGKGNSKRTIIGIFVYEFHHFLLLLDLLRSSMYVVTHSLKVSIGPWHLNAPSWKSFI